jgi:hypothetical protein
LARRGCAPKDAKFVRRMSKNGFINFYNSRDEYYTARRQKTLEKYILTAKK